MHILTEMHILYRQGGGNRKNKSHAQSIAGARQAGLSAMCLGYSRVRSTLSPSVAWFSLLTSLFFVGIDRYLKNINPVCSLDSWYVIMLKAMAFVETVL